MCAAIAYKIVATLIWLYFIADVSTCTINAAVYCIILLIHLFYNIAHWVMLEFTSVRSDAVPAPSDRSISTAYII